MSVDFRIRYMMTTCYLIMKDFNMIAIRIPYMSDFSQFKSDFYRLFTSMCLHSITRIWLFDILLVGKYYFYKPVLLGSKNLRLVIVWGLKNLRILIISLKNASA